MAVKFLPSGDCGLTVQLGDGVDREISRRIMCLRAIVEHDTIPGIVETVPTYRSLMIHYNPLLTSQSALIDALGRALAAVEIEKIRSANHWHLPVCFHGEDFAPDLGHVAEWAETSVASVVDTISSIMHFVYMIGFAPGQPYMGDLPKSLAIPRRKEPVQGIPAGSVLIATGLTIIYPIGNPTGWYVVGRCPVPIFDAGAETPFLFRPGDNVSLYPVDRDEYTRIETQVSAGGYEIQGRAVA